MLPRSSLQLLHSLSWSLIRCCSSRRCFSPIRFCLPQNYSSSPKLWQRPRCCLWNVAPRKWWDPYPTPCCLTSFMEIFPNNASMTASTLCLALRAQCFALKEVLPAFISSDDKSSLRDDAPTLVRKQHPIFQIFSQPQESLKQYQYNTMPQESQPSRVWRSIENKLFSECAPNVLRSY